MIDHVSIAVQDFHRACEFYSLVLEPLGMQKLFAMESTAGFGKAHPEFWLNQRQSRGAPADGAHICFRAGSEAVVQEFHRVALAQGGSSAGEPGPRPQYGPSYYAAFIEDPEGNRIEAVFFREG